MIHIIDDYIIGYRRIMEPCYLESKNNINFYIRRDAISIIQNNGSEFERNVRTNVVNSIKGLP